MNFTHLDNQGNANMVGVSAKNITHRTAKAMAKIRFPQDIYQIILENDRQTPKGSIEGIARIAGIMGAKQTSNLIPLCHPLPLEKCKVSFEYSETEPVLTIYTSAEVTHKTGIEMEALTAASVAALTVYDMCKALTHNMIIEEVRLLEKTGGKKDVCIK